MLRSSTVCSKEESVPGVLIEVAMDLVEIDLCRSRFLTNDQQKRVFKMITKKKREIFEASDLSSVCKMILSREYPTERNAVIISIVSYWWKVVKEMSSPFD